MAIIEYLRRNPRAGDSAEGIARWWLGAAPGEFSEVASALSCLERLSYVQRWVTTDARAQYRIGPALRSESDQH